MYALALTSTMWQVVAAFAATVVVVLLIIMSMNLRRMDNSLRIQIDHLKEVKGAVEGVHRATNSLVQKLVDSTDAEAFLRGGVKERERAEKQDREHYLGKQQKPPEPLGE